MRTPGSGRKPGTPNKDTVQLFEICKKHKIDVFESLVKIAAAEKDVDEKFDKLLKLAPYLYAQRKSMEVSNKDDQGFVVVVKDYSEKK